MRARQGDLRLGVALLMVGTVITACSSSSSGSSGSSGGGTSGSGSTTSTGSPAPKLTGTPVRIGMISSEQSQAISVPDTHRAAEIAVKRVNADGGIKGHPLQLDYCDDQTNIQKVGQCADQLLVQDKDVMLVGEAASTGGAPLYPVLKKTNKINFADYPIGPDDATNPLSYPIVPGAFQLAEFSSVVPKGSGSIDVITNTDYTSFVKGLVAPGMTAKGFTTKVIGEPATTVDWSTAANQVEQDHPKYVLLAIAQDKLTTVINALNQAGSKATVSIVSTSVSAKATDLLSSSGTPSLIASATTTNPATSPLYAQYLADIKTYGQSVGIQDTAGQQIVNAYAAVILFAKIANSLPTVDSPTFKKYLDAQSAFSTEGLTHVIDFTKPGALPGFTRILNTWNLPAKASSNGYEVSSNAWLAP